MANIAEDMGRMADGIVAGRRQRSDLATAIKAATADRRRGVRSQLDGLHAARDRASREWLQSAAAARKGRHNDVKALMAQFGRERAARRQHAVEVATAQREKAAAFMRDLTSGVAALRDGFGAAQQSRARDGRALAEAVHARLAVYGQDRVAAVAAWAGHPAKRTAATGHRPPMTTAAAQPAPAEPAEPPREAGAMSGHESAGGSASPAEPAGRAGRRGFGHQRSAEQHGEDDK